MATLYKDHIYTLSASLHSNWYRSTRYTSTARPEPTANQTGIIAPKIFTPNRVTYKNSTETRETSEICRKSFTVPAAKMRDRQQQNNTCREMWQTAQRRQQVAVCTLTLLHRNLTSYFPAASGISSYFHNNFHIPELWEAWTKNNCSADKAKSTHEATARKSCHVRKCAFARLAANISLPAN